ncbi:acyl transferase [Christiangramia fulva]|uniref:Acyl transferase n=1 Tax=Christiangramia fulva TaxID=2126553 RepID=A0A2R3Z4M8_9FLAO|nr:acyl transferase [Christiangramia fulva]AVR45237.1 acyl transferase [Christiangramia fulva]
MLKDDIFNISNSDEFDEVCLRVFQFQFENNEIYNQFCRLVNKDPEKVTLIEEIPFLPIEFFKTKKIISDKKNPEIIFTSSGTTGSLTSSHYVTDLTVYERSFFEGFKKFYGKPEDYIILALLPSYLERTGSSLIYMVDKLIKASRHSDSGFYLNELDLLANKLSDLDKTGKKVLLIGVSFALLDLVEKYNFNLENTFIMETGGMKGRRKEMIRQELHDILKKGFGTSQIHSEYGMTELLSQAYSTGNGIFECPPWMKILIRDPEDALNLIPPNKTGGINIIDLANINSCSFIATQDLGRITARGTEILGRFDNSDIRGCNLLII